MTFVPSVKVKLQLAAKSGVTVDALVSVSISATAPRAAVTTPSEPTVSLTFPDVAPLGVVQNSILPGLDDPLQVPPSLFPKMMAPVPAAEARLPDTQGGHMLVPPRTASQKATG